MLSIISLLGEAFALQSQQILHLLKGVSSLLGLGLGLGLHTLGVDWLLSLLNSSFVHVRSREPGEVVCVVSPPLLLVLSHLLSSDRATTLRVSLAELLVFLVALVN